MCEWKPRSKPESMSCLAFFSTSGGGAWTRVEDIFKRLQFSGLFLNSKDEAVESLRRKYGRRLGNWSWSYVVKSTAHWMRFDFDSQWGF